MNRILNYLKEPNNQRILMNASLLTVFILLCMSSIEFAKLHSKDAKSIESMTANQTLRNKFENLVGYTVQDDHGATDQKIKELVASPYYQQMKERVRSISNDYESYQSKQHLDIETKYFDSFERGEKATLSADPSSKEEAAKWISLLLKINEVNVLQEDFTYHRDLLSWFGKVAIQLLIFGMLLGLSLRSKREGKQYHSCPTKIDRAIA